MRGGESRGRASAHEGYVQAGGGCDASRARGGGGSPYTGAATLNEELHDGGSPPRGGPAAACLTTGNQTPTPGGPLAARGASASESMSAQASCNSKTINGATRFGAKVCRRSHRRCCSATSSSSPPAASPRRAASWQPHEERRLFRTPELNVIG